MDPLEALFRAIAGALPSATVPRIQLRIVGSTALFLQTPYRRGTRDSDVVQTFDFDRELREMLVRLAGPGTTLALRHGVHLEFVGEAILFLPEEPAWVRWLSLDNVDVSLLDPTDVVVAKLIRLHGDDLRDIDAMIELGVVAHESVVVRFRSALTRYGTSGQGDKLHRAVDNLHRVERDLFSVDETQIEIPGWMLV
jgi:hypothetical protein